jgi:hypothetical protein
MVIEDGYGRWYKKMLSKALYNLKYSSIERERGRERLATSMSR